MQKTKDQTVTSEMETNLFINWIYNTSRTNI